MSDGHAVIGRRVPLVDAPAKVSGEAVYTDDMRLPGMLVGKVLRSPHAHARILRIDTTSAAALPGVHAVADGRDAPTGRFGVLPITKDETAFAVGKASFVGDQVAAVAAVDEETALRALDLIEVAYETIPAVLRMEDALEPVEPGAEKVNPHTKYEGNVFKEVRQSFGDADGAIDGAASAVEGKFEFQGVTHAFTEPHAVVAHWEGDGRLTVWSATQVPHYLHRALADVTGLPLHRIRVVRPFVGGAFGGKSDPFPHEMAAAILSRKSGRPVKILFDREEVFISNHGRHPGKTTMALSADGEGRLTALRTDALIDGGAWGSFGVITTYYNGVLSMGPYKIPAFDYRGRRVYTNKPPCGAMRGHGAVNSRFALETLLDEVAEGLGLDPCDIRLRNAYEPNSLTPNGLRITSCGITECIEKVREASGWDERRGRLPHGRGLGIGCGFYISGSALPIHWERMPQSTVHVKVDFDAGVTVHSLAAEIGQGSDTMLAQCVAETLGCGLDRVRVYSRNTDTAPIDLGSYSSRVTFMAGLAAMRAAAKVASQVAAGAAALTGKPAEGFVLRDEEVVYAPEPGVRVPFDDAVREALHDTGALHGKGHYQAPNLNPDLPRVDTLRGADSDQGAVMGGTHKGAAAGLSPTYSMSAYVAEVEVDPETGYVRVPKVWAAHDCGKALNPLSVEGQIEGCVHMGLGQALCESFDYHRQGPEISNPTLLDYRTVPPIETPEMEVFLVESDDPEGPYGAKEAGEGPLLPILPAVANAIHDAVGVRLRKLPMTPDRVLAAMKRLERAG